MSEKEAKVIYRVNKKSLFTCWRQVIVNVLTVMLSVGSDPQGLGSMLQKSSAPCKAYVRDLLNHFPLPTQ
jgi:hypothetical protein